MSEKMTCPVCDSRTSAVLSGVREGSGCPYCGASASLIQQVDDLRNRNVESALVEQLVDLGSRAEKAEAEAARLRGILASLRHELDRVDPSAT